ncbi:hypothetical protein D1007_12923 [Hordeum vulgare]|nr:hypothetical protein D1007_12923 [Hordeum vulgare]
MPNSWLPLPIQTMIAASYIHGGHCPMLQRAQCSEDRAALDDDAGRGGAGSDRAVVDLGAPPLEVVVREEDEHPHEGGAGVERRRQHVVVLLPPPLAVPENEEVEDGATVEPADDVGGRGRGIPTKP